MPTRLADLLEFATALRVHHHFLRELRQAQDWPGFAALPAVARERHRALLTDHQSACASLGLAAGAEPTLVAALVAYLERQDSPLGDHPSARHLNTVRAVLRQLPGAVRN